LAHEPAISISCPAASFKTSAIVTFFWEVHGSLPPGSIIEFSCHEHRAIVPADRKDRWLGVHSHLLRNGEQALSIRLLDANGNTLDQKSQPFVVCNEGLLAELVRESLRHSATPLFVATRFDSSLYDYGNKDLVPWFDRNDALDTIKGWLAQRAITSDEAEHLRNFVTQGYIDVPALISPDLLTRVNKEIDEAIASGYQNYQYGTSQRIEKLHEHYPAIRELWLHGGVMRLLRLIFQAEPRPCQTLTYVFGSQQDAHQDTIHLTPFPAGYMVGVWVALQDVVPNSGELEVFVGSHKLPRVRMSEMGVAKVAGDWSEFGAKIVPAWQKSIEEHGFEKVVYRPKAGSVLIWHENLMHAGGIRKDTSLPRRSIVSHVFADGSIAYYDSSGMPGHLEPRERMTVMEEAAE